MTHTTHTTAPAPAAAATAPAPRRRATAAAAILLAAAALAAAALSGCAPKRPTLHLYTWSDYIDPALVRRFEKEQGCRVKIDIFDSNESMYAKIQAGSGGYDIIFPSSYQVALMAQNKMIRPIDKSRLPNVAKHFDPSFNTLLLDPSLSYNIPYAITFTGLAYRKDKTAGIPVDSWACLDTPALKGRISLLNDMRETIGAALKFLGFSLNTGDPAQLKQAGDLVLKWKKNIAKFDNEQYKTGVASGEFIIGHGYSGDTAQVIQDDPEKIGFSLPREGFSACCDEMVIPAGARRPDLAYAFINFLYDPEVAAANIQYICAVMPNRDAIARLPPEYRANPCIIPSPEGLKNAEVIRDLGPTNTLYIQTWDIIKGAE